MAEQISLEAIVQRLQSAGVEAHGLQQLFAGLALLPRNEHALYRLSCYAHAAAALEPSGGRKRVLTRTRARVLLEPDSLATTQIESREDPAEGPIAQRLFVEGQPEIVPVAPEFDVAFGARLIRRAVGRHECPARFREQASEALDAALSVGARIARDVALAAYVTGDGRFRSIFVPPTGELERLMSAVVLSALEVTRLKAHAPTLLLEASPEISRRMPPTGGMLCRTPFLVTKSSVILAAPMHLVLAASGLVVDIARQLDCLQALARAFHEVTLQSAQRSMRRLGLQTLMDSQPGPSETISVQTYSADRNKVVFSVVITDSFDRWSAEGPAGAWPQTGDIGLIARELHAFANEMHDPPPADVVIAFVHQGIGRHYQLYVPDAEFGSALPLFLSAADLEVMALNEDSGDSLSLWRFVREQFRLRDAVDVLSFSSLDEYAAFVDGGNSFRLETMSGGRGSESIGGVAFAVGNAYKLRAAVLDRFDRHDVQGWTDTQIVEIERSRNEESGAVYAPTTRGIDSPIALYGYSPNLRVWALGPNDSPYRHDDPVHRIVLPIAYGLASWLMKLSREVGTTVRWQVRSARAPAMVRIDAIDWTDGNSAPTATPTQGLRFPVVATSEGIRVTIDRIGMEALAKPGNEGERALLEAVATSLASASSRAVVAAAVERVLPPGAPKRLSIAPGGGIAAGGDGRVHRWRPISPSVVASVYSHLDGELKGTTLPGTYKGDEARKLINHAVGVLLAQLTQAVSAHPTKELVALLISHHEALISTIEEHLASAPARHRVFPEAEAEIAKDFADFSKTRVASNFVIELASAAESSGTKPVSLEAYDHILALAVVLCDYGYFSDAMYFKITDPSVDVEANGHYSINGEQLSQAQAGFHRAYASNRLQRLEARFAGATQRALGGTTRDAGSDDPLTARLNAASEAEYGLSMLKLLELLQNVRGVSSDRWKKGVAEWEWPSLCERVASATSLEVERAERALGLFTLEQRSFLPPPQPFSRGDVYPWRLDRALSYVRRPIVKTSKNGKDYAIFGTRQVQTSLEYFLNLHLDGRGRAMSKEMRSFLGERVDAAGEEFNRRVHAIASLRRDWVVRSRVKKLGKIRVPGDIDVLIADRIMRRVLVIECKCFVMARTPQEFRSELDALLLPERGKPSALEKHKRRFDLIRESLAETLTALGITSSEGWTAESRLVVDAVTIIRFLQDVGVPIVTIEEFEAECSGAAPSQA